MGGGGKGGSAPKAPDYEAAARATAEGNLEAAKYATQANRPTQITPWGSIEWDDGRRFNQNSYDSAMAQYQRDLAAWEAGPKTTTTYIPYTPTSSQSQFAIEQNRIAERNNGMIPFGLGGKPIPKPVAPNEQDFWSEGNDWTQTVTLSPEMQALFDQQMQLQQGLFGAQNAAADRVNETLGQGFDTSMLPEGGTALDMSSLPGFGDVYDPELATNNATELIMQRLNPQFDRQREQLQSQLANQGITQGSQAYNQAMDAFMGQTHSAEREAALSGIGLGMQQQGLTFGQQTTNQQLAAALQAQQFGQSETARQRALAEQAYLRSLPLNELNALRTGNQVSMPQFPGFAQQATTGGPDLLGAAGQQYNADLGAWNAQQAAGDNMMGGILGLGGSLLGAAGQAGGFATLFSDRRLKRNIKRIGTADNGLNIYSYQYVWGGPAQLGYMADEVERIAPHAIGSRAGYKTVNYGVL